ncbi:MULTISPECIES: hypothetical protein [Nostoc]|uniref:Uncharacterized protein n=1 Tax=Nostoc paludosum FACHB-159 TaxID=2692908 RepID=A0ABR8K9H5_9NOSO|nr:MULTISPECIES: hypothetical protein [Nostoc]MBD2679891.1 hypothetical protein [Nostoc sp. FACHB-857]MBD2736145.1 hypothetical protein [Nostoc paludosum FACHB-159]
MGNGALGMGKWGDEGVGGKRIYASHPLTLPDFQCPILLYERLRQRLRSVQVPHAQIKPNINLL